MRGVYQVKNGKWVSTLWSAGKLRNLGTYDTEDEAKNYRNIAKEIVLSGDKELLTYCGWFSSG